MKFCPECGRPLSRRNVGDAERNACEAENCGFVEWDNPIPVVAVLVEFEGKVLLARNVAWPEGMFSVISGYLEKGETPEECALREVGEELGLAGKIAGYIGHYVFARKNQLILAFHVLATGTITLNEELADYRLIEREKLKPWSFGTGPAVRDWMTQQGIQSESLPSIPSS